MARGKRIRIADCIYRDNSGFDTIVKFRGLRAYERWPLSVDVDEMLRWIARSRSELMDRAALEPNRPTPQPRSRATLAEDVPRFLKKRLGRPVYAADKSNLKAWCVLLGPCVRRKITTEEINDAIAAWRQAGVAVNTIRNRCRSLRDLFHTLDGKRTRTPVDEADIPPPPHPHPVAPPPQLVRKVATVLPTIASPRIVARFLVLATCAQRPCQVERAKPEDIDLKRKTWIVRSAKNAPSHTVYLNSERLAAWKAFIAANAWGQKVTKQYYAKLREAGYPAEISTYNVRHRAAQDALERGADLGDVQGLLGHTDIQTTRKMYAPLLASRQKRMAKLMDGRVTPKS